ncbi:DUF1697 domain-containing protein [Labilibacter marinus]|uniref:DUF1697 domain-containing protein n=1 Tax=Labilibacter marinus TaxID=1477105 RepID=UPI00094F7C19|nr:DUF1697 domain-containing protein [Labilibacter marinus]
MTTYIAILRGINVGGKRKILMADLRQMFLNIGLVNPSTYIQSGNIFFQSTDITSLIALSTKIEEAIFNKYGFEVPVIVTTHQELKETIQSNTFFQQNIDINQLHLTFLKEEPSADCQEKAISYIDDALDDFIIKGKNVYLCCKGKYHQTKFGNTFFEKKLKVTATTRSWKTVLKLEELSK